MIARMTGAAARGVLVALVVSTPALLLPSQTAGWNEIVALLAILAAGLTFVEYNSNFPSFVEFRDAPPINRIRFVALFLTVLMLTLINKHAYEQTEITAVFATLGALIGASIDFPYSPVHLMILMLPEGTSQMTIDAVRIASGLAYFVALCAITIFLFAVRVLGWPTSTGAFNVWINLPLFDPTAGGDVVHRLNRDGRTNVILGFLLPFLIPAVVKMASDLIDPLSLEHPQTLIWTVTAWAFLPASMIMRGIAMLRIADLIEEKRRRAYAHAEAMQAA